MATSKKPGETWKGHVSQAVKTRYEKKTYDLISFRVKRDGSDGISREQIKAAADACGQSVNAWIIEAIRDKL